MAFAAAGPQSGNYGFVPQGFAQPAQGYDQPVYPQVHQPVRDNWFPGLYRQVSHARDKMANGIFNDNISKGLDKIRTLAEYLEGGIKPKKDYNDSYVPYRGGGCCSNNWFWGGSTYNYGSSSKSSRSGGKDDKNNAAIAVLAGLISAASAFAIGYFWKQAQHSKDALKCMERELGTHLNYLQQNTFHQIIHPDFEKVKNIYNNTHEFMIETASNAWWNRTLAIATFGNGIILMLGACLDHNTTMAVGAIGLFVTAISILGKIGWRCGAETNESALAKKIFFDIQQLKDKETLLVFDYQVNALVEKDPAEISW